MRLTNKVRGAAVAALAATALAAWAPPALASGPDGDAVDAARIAAKAVEIAIGHETGNVPFGEATSGSEAVVAEGTDVAVVAPVNATEAIVVSSADDDSLNVGISLPVTPSANGAEVIAGEAVYVDDAAGTSFVVDAFTDGARVISVLESDRAMHEIPYNFSLPEGVEPRLQDDGSVLFQMAGDGTPDGIAAWVGRLEAPWAVDAAGVPVPTRYSVKSDVVTQIIEADVDVRYPVSADPRYKACRVATFYPGLCIDHTRSESIGVANRALNFGGQTFAQFACGAFAAVPPPVAGLLAAAACEAYVITLFTRIRIEARSILNGGSSACARLRISTPAAGVTAYSPLIRIRC